MPDALSKTIPIWCAVINRLLFGEMHGDHKLSTPKDVVSASEHTHIEALLHGFVDDVKVNKASKIPSCEVPKLMKQDLSLDIPSLRLALKKPLRPFWVTPDSISTHNALPTTTYHTIVCCTASRRVFGAELTDGGYIQGAGDDSEGWSKGLTPTLFWRHSKQLLAAVEEDMPDLIRGLIVTGLDNGAIIGDDAVKIGPTSLYIGTLSSAVQAEHYDGIVICSGTTPSKPNHHNEHKEAKTFLNLLCGEGKLGSRALRSQLPRIPPFINSLPHHNPAPKLLFQCSTGKDLSVGTVLAVLCLFFDVDNCNALLPPFFHLFRLYIHYATIICSRNTTNLSFLPHRPFQLPHSRQ